MEMNLRNARRIEREIEAIIIRLEHEMLGSVNPTISAFVDFDDAVAAHQQVIRTSLEQLSKLTTIRAVIRRSIEVANEVDKINELVSTTVFLKKMIQLTESIITTQSSDINAAKAQLLALSSTPGAMAHHQQIRLMNITDAALIQQLKTELQKNKEELFRAKETLATLNSTVHIKIADWQVPVLQDAGIILA